MMYNPSNWYWTVAGNTAQVFASVSGTLVATSDATYQGWLAAGNQPSRILSWAELNDVLQNQAPAAWTLALPTLAASGALTLAQSAAIALAQGLAITSTGTPALDGTYPADALTQQHITAEVTSILLNDTFADGTTTIAWLDLKGVPHSFPIANFKSMATAMAAFVSGNLKAIAGLASALPAASATIP